MSANARTAFIAASMAAVLVFATTPILGRAVERRDSFAVQSCRVVHWPKVQVREGQMNFCYDASP
jgi:hypothetical protein